MAALTLPRSLGTIANPMNALPRPFVLSLVLVLAGAGCGRRGVVPEEFPPVHLGMPHAEARAALGSGSARIVEDNDRVIRVVGRDRRVEEEVFLFYQDRLAAWTARYPTPATRASFVRQTRRFTMAFGEPFESRDDGLVLSSRWKLPAGGGRLLLSGYVGSRGADSPLMARVEDPSVVRRLVRSLSGESAGTDSMGDSLRRVPSS
jgi:hypothetical protein